MRIKYKHKLFLSFVFIFSLFTVGIVVFQQTCEKRYKTEALEEKLEAYADLADKAFVRSGNREEALERLAVLFPQNIRLTLIDREGNVLYDNVIEAFSGMENHAGRPEIRLAKEKQKGSDIRTSFSNEQAYLYYAKRFNSYYVRVALPYDIQVKHFLKSDNMFLYYSLILFVLVLILISYAADGFGKSIRKLKRFTQAAEEGSIDQFPLTFPDDELGEIGSKIAQDYQRLKESKKEIVLEREKLLQHVHSSEEGLCFFTAAGEVEFYNGLFIQYLNIMVDEANSDPAVVFRDPCFGEITAFLSGREKQANYFETKINRQGKFFVARVNVFDNNSFEIIINDITKQEKNHLLKREMTGNITHELRTPVTGIRGCLETVLEHELTDEKRHYFIKSAYEQVLTLSELIQDMSLITKIEDDSQSFRLEAVGIDELLKGLKKDLEIPLREKNIRMEWAIPPEVAVKGNKSLLYSIFRNLTDNVIRYAGNDVAIQISVYRTDERFYYFSYADTGVGIPGEQHLNRLFERFYRLSEGRTRDSGGSGLGLSIVKNAIMFHKGTIVAKNRAGGGLEFLFNLPY
jgi:signal transduction histidine kinase